MFSNVFVYEFYSENSGSCRFHRKWVEDIIDEIILSHFDLDIDYWKDNFQLTKEIHEHQSASSSFWESERVVDIIFGFVEKWQREGLKDPQLDFWVNEFRKDKWVGARHFWDAMYNGMCSAFEEGINEPQHVDHGFIKPQKLT